MACPRYLEFKDCKDPDSKIPYSFDWSKWTSKEGDELVNSPPNAIISVVKADPDSDDTNPIILGVVQIDEIKSMVRKNIRDKRAFNFNRIQGVGV